LSSSFFPFSAFYYSAASPTGSATAKCARASAA